MVNLLPDEAVSTLRALYYRRLFGATLVAFSFIVTFSIGALLPSTVILLAKSKTTSEQLATALARPLSREADLLTRQIKQTNDKIILLSRMRSAFSFNAIIEHVLSHKHSGIALEMLGQTRSQDKQGTTNVSLRGKARNREILLNFVHELAEDPFFAKVESPISNLISSSDIPFTLSLEIAGKNKNNE